MTSPNKEVGYINIAKTTGIFLVILAHLQIPYFPLAFISSFRMPFFFLISGFFISPQKYTLKDFVIRKARTLLIPYFFFAVVSYLFWFFIERKFMQENEHTFNYLLGILYAVPLKEYLGFNFPIWFLPCLFISEILFLLTARYAKKHTIVVMLLFLFLGIVLKEVLPFRLPWGIDVAFFSLIFIYLGYIVRTKSIVDNSILKIRLLPRILLVIALGIATAYVSCLNAEFANVSMYALRFNNFWLFLLAALTGTSFMLVLSNTIKANKFFCFYGRNTIIIMGFHILCYKAIKAVLLLKFQIIPETFNGVFFPNLLILITAVIMLTPIIYVINRYMPFLIGRKQGVLG